MLVRHHSKTRHNARTTPKDKKKHPITVMEVLRDLQANTHKATS